MKKLVFALSVLLVLPVLVHSQTLPNPGFENLDGNGFPDDWTGDGFGSGVTASAHSGNNSLSVWNWYYYAKGYAVNGNAVSVFQLNGAGTPYTQKATSLNGFYRYDTVDTYSNFDSAQVTVLLKKRNTTTQQIDTIGFGQIQLPAHAPTDGTYAPFTVNISDWDASQQPDSIVVLIQSSLNGFCENADDGNCLYFNVDDLTLATPLGITDIAGNNIKPNIYPNPSFGNFTIDFPYEEMQQVKIVGIDGKLVHQSSVQGMQKADLSLTNLTPGIYLAEVITESGRIFTERIVLE